LKSSVVKRAQARVLPKWVTLLEVLARECQMKSEPTPAANVEAQVPSGLNATSQV